MEILPIKGFDNNLWNNFPFDKINFTEFYLFKFLQPIQIHINGQLN